ncbi:alpha-1,4-glucan--maltose-1-phosphate maltosyltransferase [Brachybacterium endophyticum]|uniref:Alpha-1,4-glucan:maltose-1-phosphate maltosyltransferase n=1 Tax=Brachybacterium endophyticum TaxID=2182385 RepID=A0A2U2RI10_9MICO|nr:maltotransferase domain-containing protein [Brachybacterium endophyticum]PWH05405.1 alpha-1,4-glucan--maltose-1-phosphate maltosyltransferase [Brachybacterium endophyticum]
MAPTSPSARTDSSLSAGIGRIPVMAAGPVVDDDRFPASCAVGESVRVWANAFREGHDAMGVQLVLRDPEGGTTRRTLESANPGLDLWETRIRPDAPGHWSFSVEAFADPYATWAHVAEVKIPAGIDEDLVIAEGQQVLTRVLAEIEDGERPAEDAPVVRAALASLGTTSLSPAARVAPALAEDLRRVLTERPLREGVTVHGPHELIVHRRLALVGSWYEFFPRSVGARFSEGRWIGGTLRSAAGELDRVAAMGFDVAYLTPIHPIGETFRKGRNNTLDPRPGDPGSPYAIGSADGGHEAIHPDLGTMEDFEAFVGRARELGLEVALDIALQCSPDHPWVREHPEWFVVRPDGSIAYAENPPKKYQDIYPLSFDTDYDGLYAAIRDVLEGWVRRGVTLFRVDNPHTKPVRFWQELLAEFDRKHPEVIFLAEAFTRPTMMHTLGKVGFHQSYSYFTWRHTPEELREYLLELAESAPYMRPSFWPTTHDILTPFMSAGGRAAFRLRAILAATLVPTWGIYSGYELVEDVPRPGAEEQIDNEKYEYRPRDFEGALQRGVSLEPLLTQLNLIRREHPALQTLTEIVFHEAEDPQVVVFSKHLDGSQTDSGRADTVLVVSLTRFDAGTASTIHLDLAALDVEAPFEVEDLLTGERFTWDEDPFVILSPTDRPAHVLRVVRTKE